MPVLQQTEKGEYVITPSQTTGAEPTVKTSPYRQKREARELQALMNYAKKQGVEVKAQKALAGTEKLSTLERIGRGLTAFETGDALYGTLYEDKPFLKTYAMGIGKGLASAITGKDYYKEDPKKTFKDILTVEGMRDRPGKIDPVDIAGLAGDIFTDPTTFVGGFIGKGIAKSIKVGYGISKKIPVVGKAVAASEKGVRSLFEPFYKVEKLGETGKKYHATYNQYVKSTRNSVNDFLTESSKRAVAAEKIAGKGIGAEIAVAKEAGEKIKDIQEARKYKSAEDFMNSQVKVFRAGEPFDKLKITDFGISVAKKKSTAEIFGGKTRGIEELFIDKRAKILKDIPDSIKVDENFDQNIIQYAKDRGFDGIDIAREGVDELRIINPDILKTKSQLTDFYAQAVKEVEEVVEAGGLTGNKLIDDIVNEMTNIQETMTKAEVKRGILPATLPNYVHHLLTPEAMNAIRKGGVDFTGLIKPIRVKLGAAKARKLEGTIKEINDELREKLGYNLFEPDYFKAFAKRGISSLQALKTYDFLKSTAAKFGKKSEVDIIDNFGVKYVSSKAPQLKGFKFPEPIAEHLDDVQKILSNDEATNAFIRTYDKVLGFWKGAVTGYFPAFHTRNAIAGIFNNWLAGINNPQIYLDAEKILQGASGSITTKAGKVISYDEIRRLVKDFGVTGQTGYLDVANYLQTKINPTLATKLRDAPSKVMGAIENRLRTPLFIDGLKNGLTAEQAAKRVIKYHFDYMPEGLTGFEKTIMRRLIPFYTWTRNNIPLQLEQIIMQPGKFASVFKTQRAMGLAPSTEEESVIPRWLRERFVVKGEGGYWSGLGLPIEDMVEKISQPLRGFGISLSPLIKTPLEMVTDYNVFKERVISEDIYGKQYRNMPDFLKKWMEFREEKTKTGTYYTVNPHKKYWLELIGARGLSTALRLSNTSEDRKNLWTLITTITKYEYDIESLKQWSTREKREAVEKALYEAGLLRKKEIYYEAK